MKIYAVKNSNSFKSYNNSKKKTTNVSDSIANNHSNSLQVATNTSNINQRLINKKSNLAFKGNLTTLTKNLIKNADIPKGCLELDCHDVHLDGTISLKKIISKAKEAFFASDSATGHVELNDSVFVDEIESNTTTLNGFSKAKKIITKFLSMFDSTKVESVHSSNIELKNKPNIDKVIADEDLTLYGEGSIGDIHCKGSKIFITGPVEIKGKIKFDTDGGEIFIFKNKKNESATISSRIENGSIKQQIKATEGKKVILNNNIFKNSLDSILSEIKISDKKQILGKYKDIQSIKTLYSGKNSKWAGLNSQETAQAGYLYDNFAQNTILTLAETSKDKSFTAFWTKNKKIGNKNLVDFWLSSIGIKADTKTYAEKAKILNDLSGKQKQDVIGNTVDYWVKEIMPEQLNMINKNDIHYLNVMQSGENILEKLNNGRKNELVRIINEEGIEKFESTKKGNKKLIDFWIDTIEGDGAAIDYSSTQKQRRLLEIFSSDENSNKIYNATMNETSEISTQIQTTQKAYSNLLEGSELDKTSKSMLSEYFNNQLFFHIVNGKAKDKKSITSLEVSAQTTIKNLESEKNIAIQDARNNIFEPLKDFHYMSDKSNPAETEGKIQIVMSILKDKISNSLPIDAEKTKASLKNFSKVIDTANGETEPTWKQLLGEAQQYFEDSQSKKIVDINLGQAYFVQKTLEKDLPSKIKLALDDKTLNNSQKAFISRYKDDNNLINLLEKPAVNRSEDIDNLIASEQLNNNVFDALSSEFRKNISPETLKAMPEMTDTYIRLLGTEPQNMTIKDKYYFLSEIPDEELALVSRDVKKHWSDKFLSKYMSDSILDKVRAVDSGYQSARMAKKLDTISIQLDGQQHTLSEISQNIDHFIDVYKTTSTETNTHLSQMAKTMEDIHVDTSNIKTNVKAMLFHSIQSTKDPVLKKEMGELLQDADRMELSQFLQTVEYKQKLYEQDHKMQKVCGLLKQVAGPALLIGGAFAAGPFAPAVASIFAAHGAPVLGHLVSSGIIGHAVNTAIQCSGPKMGFIGSLLTKGKYGDIGYGEIPQPWNMA